MFVKELEITLENTMASYLEKYQVLDELKKIDKFKSEGKI